MGRAFHNLQAWIIQRPLNAKLLHYLLRISKLNVPVLALWNSVPNAYGRCGCHPDIVYFLWDEIGKALPTDCRALVYGTPALVHSNSGVILAIGVGTASGLLLPSPLASLATQAGAKTVQRWSTGGEMDLQKQFGMDWFFDSGIPLQDQLCLCKEAYEILC